MPHWVTIEVVCVAGKGVLEWKKNSIRKGTWWGNSYHFPVLDMDNLDMKDGSLLFYRKKKK